MSDVLPVAAMEVENCEPECQCQSVWVVILDAEEDPFALACMQADTARRMAAQLVAAADMADARRLKLAGRIG